MVRFFLSYYRKDDPQPPPGSDSLVKRFFDDLAEEVAAGVGQERDDVGFLDSSVGIGTDWRRRLSEELSTCHVFVPLYSPRYFGRENCGKEWWIFSERLREQRLPDGLVIPVVWISPAGGYRFPEFATRLQLDETGLPTRYRQEGLRPIAVDPTDKDYRATVLLIARRIAEMHTKHALEPSAVTDFATAVNAFETRPGDGAPPGRTTPTATVYFVLTSPTSAELTGVRSDGDGRYGEHPDEWKPFHPEHAYPLIGEAMAVAHEQKLLARSERAGDKALVDLIKQAEQEYAAVILLVDVWSGRVDRLTRTLRHFDDYNSYNAAVIMPINPSDVETGDVRSELEGEIEKLLYKCTSRVVPESPADFTDALDRTLYEVRRRIHRRFRKRGDAPGSRYVGPPLLDGPGRTA